MRSGFDLAAKITRLQVGANEYGAARIDTAVVVADNVPCYLWERTSTKLWGFDLSQQYDYTATLLLPQGITVELGDMVEVTGPRGPITVFRVLTVDYVDYLPVQATVIVSGEVLDK